jgi:hypothetical protein
VASAPRGWFDPSLVAAGWFDDEASGYALFDRDNLDTVSGGTSVTVTPGVGVLTATGLAPTVMAPALVLPGVGALTATGLAPTVTAPALVFPGVGALTATGLAPTVTAPALVLPGVGVLTLEGAAPTVTAPVLVIPGVGVLVLEGLVPTVISGGTSITVTPGVGILTLEGWVPVVSDGTVVDLGEFNPATTGAILRGAPRRKRRVEWQDRVDPSELTPAEAHIVLRDGLVLSPNGDWVTLDELARRTKKKNKKKSYGIDYALLAALLDEEDDIL